MTLTDMPGYLSNLKSVTSDCGHIPDSPWKIQVKIGQKINLTLFEFSDKRDPDDKKCRTYAIVRERSLGRTRNITLCSAVNRQRIVYTSVTNQIEIGLSQGLTSRYFLKYEGKLLLYEEFFFHYLIIYLTICGNIDLHSSWKAMSMKFLDYFDPPPGGGCSFLVS